jgi:hypothetical protein
MRWAAWIILVVVTVCALGLAWLADPFAQRIPGEDDMRLKAKSDLQRIIDAVQSYHDAFGEFPKAVVRDKNGKPLYSWRVSILLLLEKKALFDEFHLDEAWDSLHNIKLLEKMPLEFASVHFDVEDFGKTPYQVFVGPGTAFEKDGLRRSDFPDGLDKTLFIIEAAEAVPWTKPVDLAYDPNKPLPPLANHYSIPVFFGRRLLYRIPCCNAAFGDGKVYSLPLPIDDELLRGYITRNGGEHVTLPEGR